MAGIKFHASIVDTILISNITKRAVRLIRKNGGIPDSLGLVMDITAVHLNGCPLKLKEWLKADNFNFIHDIQGISRYVDRHTGKLTNCFLPRFAK